MRDDVSHPRPWVGLTSSGEDASRPDAEVPRDIPDELTSRTGFKSTDVAPEHQKLWERLERKNSGQGDASRGTQLHRAGIERDLGVVTTALGTTTLQQQRAQWLLERIDLKAEVIPDGRLEAAIVAAVTLAIDEDRTRHARTSDANAQSVLRDDAFAELLEDFRLGRGDVRRARRNIRETDVYESPNRG